MTQIPDAANYIQIEETEAYAPVSESTLFKVGGSMNYLLDHYPMPPGMIIPYAGLEASVILSFMIPADGRPVSRTTYANLFANIGTLAGVGDGISTFNVPDLRGYFIRGQDTTSIGSAGRDPDETSRTPVGTGTYAEANSTQGDQLGAHNHYLNIGGSAPPHTTGLFATGTSDTGPTYVSGAGGNEDRPINYYMLYCVKT